MISIETVILFTLVLVVDVIVVVHILMNKHEEPTSAVLWLFIVCSFPVFGVILYLFFGINHIKTLGLRVELANEQINAAQKSQIYDTLKSIKTTQNHYKENTKEDSCLQYNRTIDNLLTGTAAIKGNNLELLENGTAAYPKMLAAINQAKSSIHLQSFIIHNDEIGKQILDAVQEKSRQGIKVKVLYDKFGSLKATFSLFFLKYRKSNFSMQPFAFINLFNPWRVQLRNHRKLLVVDGKIAFIGGINISSDNDIRVCNKDKYIHDLHCQIEGPVVANLQFSFLRDWHYATKTPISQIFAKEYFPELNTCGEATVRVIDSGPGQNYAATEKIYATAAATAKESLWILTPYFTPDRAFINALIMAAARGVEVIIIVPKRNNHWYAQFASRSFYQTLIHYKIKVLEKTGLFSHAKAMLVDKEWAFMGSSNCDVRSFRLNYELDFIAADKSFINQLHNQFLTEISQSEVITLPVLLKKNFIIKLLENICSLLIPVL